MKKLAFAGGAVGFGLAALLVVQHQSHAADHLDSPTLVGNPMSDINDVYAWMSTDAKSVNLAMTISPGDPGNRTLGPATQYVFHVTSKAGAVMDVVGAPGGDETKVICTFVSNTEGSCWIGTKDYVTGNPSAEAGISSASGKVKFFAGRRSDPFFFNLAGFRSAVKIIEGATLTFNAEKCPTVDAGTATTLNTALTEQTHTNPDAPCPAAEADCFAGLNVIAIVLQVDKTLFNTGTNQYLSVWGSTHTAP